MKIKVSIIVPIYNIENYIGDCIQSLVNQTYANIEILLINDGSTDQSLAICEQFASKDQRIKIYTKKNGGLSSSRNYGLDYAKGEYILFVDGDDQLNKYAIEQLMNVCEASKHTVDFVQFKYKEIYDCNMINHEDINKTSDFVLESNKEKMFEYIYQIGGEAVSSCTKLYKRKLFDKLRFKEGILHEDEYIISDIIDASSKCAYFNQYLYYYIMRNGSIIRSNYTSRKKDVFLSVDKRIKYFEDQGFDCLLQKEYSKYFVILVTMYVSAKKAKCFGDCKEIKNRMILLLKENISIQTSKNMKLLFSLCKLNIIFLDLYCMLKK